MELTSALNLVTSVILSVGSSSALILGLSSWLGKVWANRILEKDKAKFQNEMEIIKSNHLKDIENLKSEHLKSIEEYKNKFQAKIKTIEQFHQISQSTYEKLFQQKVETYTNLMKEKTEYIKTINEDELFESNNRQIFFLSFFSNISKIIDKNRLYISNKLSNCYDDLYKKISPILKEIEFNEISGNVSELNPSLIETKKQNIAKKMMLECVSEINTFISQIDCDVILLRKKIEMEYFDEDSF